MLVPPSPRLCVPTLEQELPIPSRGQLQPLFPAKGLRWLRHEAHMAVLARMEDSMACSSVRADGRLW